MERRERRNSAQHGNLKRKRVQPASTLSHAKRGGKSVAGELQPLRRFVRSA
jgi:hypothetical protein